MRHLTTALLLILATGIGVFAQEEARLMRFPAIYDNQVVFNEVVSLDG